MLGRLAGNGALRVIPNALSDGPKLFNIFYPGRNTGRIQSAATASEAVKKACAKPSTGAIVDGKCVKPVAVVEIKPGTVDFRKVEKGQWIRTRVDGSTNSSTGDYKFRPQLKKLAKGRDFS